MTRYRQVYSGYTDEAIFKRGKITARNRCCDCGLVHDYTFWLLRKGRRFGLRRKIEVNKRATAAGRMAIYGDIHIADSEKGEARLHPRKKR